MTDQRQRVTDRARQREAHRVVKRRKPKSIKRRQRLEKDPEQWLKYYFPTAYRLPFGRPHKEMIMRAQYAVTAGGSFAVAGPRGFGKSVLFWGLCLFFLFTGASLFPGYLPWNAVAQKRGLRFWKNALCFNRRLAADYPELCDPFIVSRGSAQRCLALVWDDGSPTGAKINISEGLIILPDSLGCLGSATINGNPRGLNLPTEDGGVLRPDVLFIDDVQDKETARSATLVANTIDVIDTDVMGMAGPDTVLPALMACTVLAPDDVSSHYLGPGAPDWDAYLIPQIEKWPRGWTAKKSKTKALWDEWNEVRLNGAAKRDRGKSAKRFYLKHKKAMTVGMKVSWRHRYDKRRGQPDALYAAMWDYYRLGHRAFMAERQNQPERPGTQIYVITSKIVAGKVCGLAAGEIPEAGRTLVGFSDINRAGLHWCLVSFAQDMTPHVPAYGKYPQRGDLWEQNAPEQVRKKAIYAGLTQLCTTLGETQFKRGSARVPISLFLVDRGYEPEIVHRFIMTAKVGFPLLPSRGYAAHKYFVRKATLVGVPRENCHMTESQFGRFISSSADYWREIAQRSWLGSLGEPGTATLFGDDPRMHTRFSDHQCAEKLVNKYQTDIGIRWEWTKEPGRHNDLGDAYVGCWVAAAFLGLRSDGIPVAQPKRKKRRRVTHVKI